MKRVLIVVVAALEERLRAKIREAARTHGFEAAFYESDAQAMDHMADAEILLSASGELHRHARALRWQCTPSAGVNQFAGGVGEAMLSNSSGAYGVTIAEHIVMVTLEMLRRQQDYADVVARRAWTRDLPVRGIRGSRVALLGTGDIGREAAMRLRAFSPARLVGFNRSGKNPQGLFDRVETRVEDVLPETDIVILSLPGTPETRHLLDETRLSLLPDGALIVNVGRGNAIEERALERQLRAGRLFAALDVFEQEPLPPQHTLWTCPNLLITPHCSGNLTLPYTRERVVDLFLEDFENYCAGRPLLRRVDLRRGY